MPRTIPRRTPVLAALALAAFSLAGCLERSETIHINDDGAVTMTSVFKGDPADVTTGDALPEVGSAWKVTDFQDTDKDNKPRLTRTATLDVGPGQALPDSYTTSADARYGVSLRFPTTLTTERRADGLYFHFKRTYLARDDARYTWVRRAMEEVPEYKALKGRDPKTMNDTDRAKLLNAFKLIEMDKQMHFVDAGLAVIPNRPQDVGLRLRVALLRFADAYDTQAILDLLAKPESKERDAAIDAIARSFLTGARKALEKAMQSSPLTMDERQAFLAAFDTESARRAVTEDLADEKWEVRVEMPGTIVASNADTSDETTAVWAFPAGAIMDRDQVLMVTSRLDSSKR